MARNPFYSRHCNYDLGKALNVKGDWAAAAAALQDALEPSSTPVFPRAFLAAALVRLNRSDDAEG